MSRLAPERHLLWHPVLQPENRSTAETGILCGLQEREQKFHCGVSAEVGRHVANSQRAINFSVVVVSKFRHF